tara:strand:- start:1287 stop:1508 length:222 start_codon:yes stop_codon:yes gene_type:complete
MSTALINRLKKLAKAAQQQATLSVEEVQLDKQRQQLELSKAAVADGLKPMPKKPWKQKDAPREYAKNNLTKKD